MQHFGGKLESVRELDGHLIAGPVAQWITRLTTDQKIPGSNPGRFEAFNEIALLQVCVGVKNIWRTGASIPVPLTC